ncbi:hypothetical protein KP003_10815 [Geomonas nitrogeniifigens]|uniref:ABC-three component system protein n=1 Tax=Geomonas diazotrophica TaxID=2843197 RepID=UPI001C2C5FAC|nr:ABC-three component system protein [Geomonas nitrogeniifigens]QXE84899.1 hypothetical protein KP003_10815 [Geomonas nitrogeniifigens]
MAHDASATWNGFNYQGKVAIFHSLRVINQKLNEDPHFDFSRFELVLEHNEDFEIRDQNGPQSFHQVKAYNETSYSKFEEALLELAIEIKKHPGVKGYLHTWKAIDLPVGTSFESKIIESLREIIRNYDEALDKNVSVIAKSLTKAKDIPKKAKIIRRASIQPQTADGIKAFLEEAIEGDTKSTNRIERYKYPTELYCCDIEEINNLIPSELEVYYVKNGTNYTSSQVDKVVKFFLGKIDSHIIERHRSVNKGDPIPIKFDELLNIVNTDLEDMSDTYLANKFKDQFVSLLPLFCSDTELCSDNSLCDENKCNWHELTDYLCQLPPETLWDYYRGFSPHKKLTSKCNTDNAFEADIDSILHTLFPIFIC